MQFTLDPAGRLFTPAGQNVLPGLAFPTVRAALLFLRDSAPDPADFTLYESARDKVWHPDEYQEGETS